MPVASPARLARRLNAATIDGLVCLGLGCVAFLLPGGGAPARVARVACVWIPVFLLEPLLIRFTGSTVGQHLLALHVAPLRASAMSFGALLLRYWMKLLLGFPSFAYLVLSERGQALHDRLFGTLVWHVPPGASLPPAGSWSPPEPDPTLPPVWRRLAAFCCWSIVAQLAIGVGLGIAFALVADTKTISGASEPAALVLVAITELWMLHRAARGGLWGARRVADVP